MITIPNELVTWLEEDDFRSLKISVVRYAAAWNLRLEDARKEYGITMNLIMATPEIEVSNQLKYMVKQMEKND